MAAKTTKKAIKRVGVAKTKRVRAKPLVNRAAARLTSAPIAASTIAARAPAPANPLLVIFDLMARAAQAYAEFPLRLAQCRTPADVLGVQAAFTRRILDA